MDKQAFLDRALVPESKVETAVGIVRVRGLTRAEVIEISTHKNDRAAQERLTLQYAMLEPVLDADDVAAYHAMPGVAQEIDDIVREIQRLSFDGKEGTKSSVPRVRSSRGT